MFLMVSFWAFTVKCRVSLGFIEGFFWFLESSTLGFFRVSFRVSSEFHVVCRLHVI